MKTRNSILSAAFAAMLVPLGASANATFHVDRTEAGTTNHVVQGTASRAEVILVSGLGPEGVGRTYARFAPDLAAALARARERAGGALEVAVLPDAADLVPRPL